MENLDLEQVTSELGIPTVNAHVDVDRAAFENVEMLRFMACLKRHRYNPDVKFEFRNYEEYKNSLLEDDEDKF